MHALYTSSVEEEDPDVSGGHARTVFWYTPAEVTGESVPGAYEHRVVGYTCNYGLGLGNSGKWGSVDYGCPVDLFEAEIRAISPNIATKSSFEPEGSQMTHVPDIARTRVGGCEDIKHALDIPGTRDSTAHS